MEIRRARDEDYVEVADLRQSTIRNLNSNDYPEHVIDRWASTLEAQDLRESASQYMRWVALADNVIVGFCEHALT